jgi:hypothetical protein
MGYVRPCDAAQRIEQSGGGIQLLILLADSNSPRHSWKNADSDTYAYRDSDSHGDANKNCNSDRDSRSARRNADRHTNRNF